MKRVNRKLNIVLGVILFLAMSVQGALAFRGHGGFGAGSQAGGGLATIVSQLPVEDLSQVETDAVLKMVEEEKLARDVYTYLYQVWNTSVFDRISNSEQRHMDAVTALLNKYNLANPVEGLDYGQFATPEMQELYDTLIAKGQQSIEDALQVGATIEDLDIKDLEELMPQYDNQDVLTVFQNLTKGSRNHLRAFTGYLKAMGITYTAQYLSQDEIDEIISSPWERGAVDKDGNPMSGQGGRGRGGHGCPCQSVE